MLDRLISPFREFGWFAGILYSADRVLQRLSPRTRLHFYELMVQPISDKPLLSTGLVKSFEFREITRGQPEIVQMLAPVEIKESRFQQGARCLGVYKSGELVGYLWFGFGRYNEDEVRCTYELSPSEQSVFDFDLYLFPAHRMGLAFAATWHGANAFLRERGIRYTFSRVTRFNLPSLRAHSHLGGTRLGSAIFLQVGVFEAMAATVFPFLHMSLRSRGRVLLRLAPDALRE